MFNLILIKEKIISFFCKNKDVELQKIKEELSEAKKQIENLEEEKTTIQMSKDSDIKKHISKLKALEDENGRLRTRLDSHKIKIQEEKEIKSQNKLKQWSDRVKKAGEYKCDICSDSDKLTAHHLWDKSNHPSLMYQDENGVCLCQRCHNNFHQKYNGTHCSPSLYQKYKIYAQAVLHLYKNK